MQEDVFGRKKVMSRNRRMPLGVSDADHGYEVLPSQPSRKLSGEVCKADEL
jgi:hypothetical protein